MNKKQTQEFLLSLSLEKVLILEEVAKCNKQSVESFLSSLISAYADSSKEKRIEPLTPFLKNVQNLEKDSSIEEKYQVLLTYVNTNLNELKKLTNKL